MRTQLALLILMAFTFGCAHITDDGPSVFGRGCGLTLKGVELDLDRDGEKQKLDVAFVAHTGFSDTLMSGVGWIASLASNFFGGGANPDRDVAKSMTGCMDLLQALRASKTAPATFEPFVVKLEPL